MDEEIVQARLEDKGLRIGEDMRGSERRGNEKVVNGSPRRIVPNRDAGMKNEIVTASGAGREVRDMGAKHHRVWYGDDFVLDCSHARYEEGRLHDVADGIRDLHPVADLECASIREDH